MKLFYLYLLIFFSMFTIEKNNAQSFTLTAGTNGTSHLLTNCKGSVVAETITNSSYSEGIDRWETFTNGGTEPLRLNIYRRWMDAGDQLRIYSGAGIGGALLATYTGAANTSTTAVLSNNITNGTFVTSSNGVITVRFTTDIGNPFTTNNGIGFQGIFGCQPIGINGNPPAGDNCETATRICDAVPYSGNTGGWYTTDHEEIDYYSTDPYSNNNPFCGAIDNNSWLVFTANSSKPSFNVDVSDCADPKTGIQMILFETTSCNTFTPLSTCISQNTVATSFTLSPLTNVSLTPGKDYYLMVDGASGNYCSYTVTPLNGVATPTISSSASNTICAGITSTLSLSGTVPLSTYTWVSSSPGSIIGTYTTSVIVITPTITSTYSVLVNQPNGCSNNTYTRTIVIKPTPTITSAGTTSICSGIPLNYSLTASVPSSFSWIAANNLNTSGESTVSVSSSLINNTIINNTAVNQLVTYTVVPTSTGSCIGATKTITVTVNPTPTTTASTTGTLTCLTPSVVLNSTLGGLSYTWTAPPLGIVGSANTQSTTVSTAGIFTLNVLSTAGCVYSTTTSVTQNTATPIITATNSTTLTCLTTTAALSGTGGGSYLWTGPGIISGSLTANPTVTVGGTYSLTVTATNGCIAYATTLVDQNIVTPTVTVNQNSFTTTCTSPTVQITGIGSSSTVTYSWTAPIPKGTLNNYTISNPIATGSGIFTVTVTDAVNGCSSAVSQATIEVVADTIIPSIAVNISTATITCLNPTPSITVTTTASPVSYSWTPTIGIVAGTATTGTPSFSLPGTYSLVVTNTSNGCATTSNTVTVLRDNFTPTITLSSSNGSLTCINKSLTTTANVLPSTVNLTYTWSPSTGISTSVNQASVTFTAAGVYTIAVTNTLTGCMSSSALPVTYTVKSNTQSPTANPVITSSNTSIGCNSNSNITYSVSGTTVNGVSPNFNWNPPGSTGSVFTTSIAGIYSVTATDPVNGCKSVYPFTVTEDKNPPNLNVVPTVNTPCASSVIPLSASSTNTNVSYLWTGPSAAIITGSASNTPTVNIAGDYIVTVTDLVSTCTSSALVTVKLIPITAAFTADPKTGVEPLTVNFTNQSLGATSYSWIFTGGSPSTSTNTNPSTIYNLGGTYTAILIAYGGVCTDTARTTIIVRDDLSLIIPNVFTPNGDNINDVLLIHTTGAKEVSLSIFNRWGLKLHETTGASASWDGNVGNTDKAVDGTYFYMIKVIGFDEKVIEKQGTVNLFR